MIAPLLKSVFRKDRARSQAETLYAAIAEQARAPQFFTYAGIPDTVEGRFEALALHMTLALERLRREGPECEQLTRKLQEVFFERLDSALREMGVGDLSVGRKIRGMAESFYGRYAAYREALAKDDGALAEAIARNALSTDRADKAATLEKYMRGADALLRNSSIDELAAGFVSLRSRSGQLDETSQ